MDSSPASLESQRSQRKFSLDCQLTCRRFARAKLWQGREGRKLMTRAHRTLVSRTNATSLRIIYLLRVSRIVLYVRRLSCLLVFLEDQRQT